MNKLQALPIASVMAVGLVIAQSGAALAEAKNIVLVHGANVDGSTWRDVYDRLTAEDYEVTVVQMPLTSAQDDIAAVQRIVDVQDGPMLLVGHRDPRPDHRARPAAPDVGASRVHRRVCPERPHVANDKPRRRGRCDPTRRRSG